MARRLITILVAATVGGLVLVGAGCGGGGSSSTASETTAPTTTTETTTPATTTTATTTTSSTPTFATAQNCQEFSAFGQQVSQAFSGSGNADLQTVADNLDKLAASAPSEIKDDFQTLADGYKQIADALQGVDLKSGQTPDPAALAKLSQLGTQLSTKLTTAATNIATWAQQNCT